MMMMDDASKDYEKFVGLSTPEVFFIVEKI